MKIQQRLKGPLYALAAFTFAITSCSKEVETEETTEDLSASTIAILASGNTAISGVVQTADDSVYVMHSCKNGEKREIIAEASMAPGITEYLSATYAGYTFHKAFAIKTKNLSTTGYVVIVFYNDKPVALQFDLSGNFVKVLEQREKGDLRGRGWHRGGRFDGREGRHKDTVALSALPSAVQSYLTANYAGDTLVKAFKNRDSSLVVISKNNGLFATIFSISNSFMSRIELTVKKGKHQDVTQNLLPSTVLSYLDTTYPNYEFKKAFSFTVSGAIKGYIVLIDANNSKYAVSFDASGNFIKAKAIY